MRNTRKKAGLDEAEKKVKFLYYFFYKLAAGKNVIRSQTMIGHTQSCLANEINHFILFAFFCMCGRVGLIQTSVLF